MPMGRFAFPRTCNCTRLIWSAMRNLSINAFFITLMSYPLLWAQDNPPRVDIGAAPPRIEIGPVVSSAKLNTYGDTFADYHVGAGGRVTLNFNRFVGAEVESTRQPTDNRYIGDEVHTSIAAKGTYRKEQARWLKFAGLNFFGVAGLGFLNRPVAIADPSPPRLCIRCTVPQRQTRAIFDFGGGVEVVPIRSVSVRFDVTGAKSQQRAAYCCDAFDETRVFIKTAIMFRFK